MKKIKIKQATKTGWIWCDIGGVADLGYPSSKTRRGRTEASGQICPAVTSQNFHAHRIEEDDMGYRIRKLTPKECFRLQGYSDEDFEKAEAVCSNARLYAQIGNAICISCLEAIFGQLFEGKENFYKDKYLKK